MRSRMVMSYFISFILSYPRNSQTKYYSETRPCSFQEVKMLNCTTHDDGRRLLTTILGYLSDSGYIKTQKTSRLFITVLHNGEL